MDFDSSTDKEKKIVFVYCVFCLSQHDSFVIADNLSGFYDHDEFRATMSLFKNSSQFIFVTANRTDIRIYQVEFFNNI